MGTKKKRFVKSKVVKPFKKDLEGFTLPSRLRKSKQGGKSVSDVDAREAAKALKKRRKK